jgi:hypothetical protein
MEVVRRRQEDLEDPSRQRFKVEEGATKAKRVATAGVDGRRRCKSSDRTPRVPAEHQERAEDVLADAIGAPT